MERGKKVTEKDILIFIIIVTAIVGVYFVYVNFIPKSLFVKKISVEIIEITGDCNDCFDLNLIIKEINTNGMRVDKKTLSYDSEEGKKLITKYSLERAPALVVLSKNLDKLGLSPDTFSIKGNSAVFDKSVPYIDLNSEDIIGLVRLKEIYDSSCAECSSLSGFKKQLEAVGIGIEEYESIDSNSENGKNLIAQNNLKFTPSLLISKDIENYWWVFSQLEESLTENDEYYVLKNPVFPYKDLTTQSIKGKVDITYLTDNSCENCYNISILKSSFQSLGIYIDDENYVDISSTQGKGFLSKYEITAVPTVILSKEIKDYELIKEALEQVGTFETDGKFIFRKLDLLNVEYTDLNK